MNQDIFEITREPIDKLGLEKKLLTGAAGAVVTFDGVVRDNTKGRRVTSLRYEAYEPMAIKEMRRIGDEIRERWPDVERVGVIHRFGPMQISESSVVIVITSIRRGRGLLGARDGGDTKPERTGQSEDTSKAHRQHRSLPFHASPKLE